jgi:predicted enzyme related to lactoylglutathione lyase
MSNPVMQFQMISKAPEETARFYSSLFGWKVDADNPMGYRQINTGSPEGIQGGIWPAPPQATNFVQLFMSVEDVAASGRKGAWPRRQGPDPTDHASRGR